MADRNKDVMVFRYDSRKRYFLVSLHLENKPGELGNLANLLGIRGINILEGFFGSLASGAKGNVSFFAETTNERMDAAWLRDYLKSSVGVSDVEVKAGVEGFLTDSQNFPITWNSGDRAVLMRVQGLKAMLSAVKEADPVNGDAIIYRQGLSYGTEAWMNLFGVHRPATKEGLAEMLRIYVATGWGRLELQDLDLERKRARVRVDDGFECAGLATGTAEGHFFSGHLAGALSVFFGMDVKAAENRCISRGDGHCEFQISA